MPAARKVHTDPVPYLGGLAIILSFVAAMVLGVLVHPLAGSYAQVAAILGGGLVLAGMGLWDDLKVIPGWVKVPVEIVVALGLFAAGVRAQPFRRLALSPIHPGKDHISHRLVRVGIPSRAAVGLIYFASASCGWLGVVIAYARPWTAYLLMGWLVVVALFLGWLLLRVEVD